VLVTVPMDGRVLRFAAETLEPRGSFDTVFGVRTLALDEGRQLLFCGSLATGYMAILDLRTGKELTRYYIAPWLRTIQPVPDRQIAYVSANGAIYQIDYHDVGG
jgi:hypothetical protein